MESDGTGGDHGDIVVNDLHNESEIEREDADEKLYHVRRLAIASSTIWIIDADAAQMKATRTMKCAIETFRSMRCLATGNNS
jgi:hypothetical protein